MKYLADIELIPANIMEGAASDVEVKLIRGCHERGQDDVSMLDPILTLQRTRFRCRDVDRAVKYVSHSNRDGHVPDTGDKYNYLLVAIQTRSDIWLTWLWRCLR
jgi:hypothetical protein